MLVVTGSDTRHQFYCRLVHHSAVMKFSPPGFAITIEPYRVRSAAKSLQLLTRGNSGSCSKPARTTKTASKNHTIGDPSHNDDSDSAESHCTNRSYNWNCSSCNSCSN